MDFINELLIDFAEFFVEFLNLIVQTDEGLFVGESLVEVSNGVKVGVFELIRHLINGLSVLVVFGFCFKYKSLIYFVNLNDLLYTGLYRILIQIT